MPKSVDASNRVLALLYNATAWPNVADNASAAPLTQTYVSAHIGSPGTGNNQTTNETAYTNYARVAVARTTGGWSAPSAGSTANVAQVALPQCGVTGATLSHVAAGTAASGAGNVWHQGALNASLIVSSGITPVFAPGALVITES